MTDIAPAARPTSGAPSLGRFLFYSPSVRGGIPRHTRYQAQELASRGAVVELLCHKDFPIGGEGADYTQLPRLIEINGDGRAHKVLRVLASVVNYHILAWTIVRRRPQVVVMEANTEYFSPFWALPHWLLSWLGVLYLANFHDPVRKRWFGPEWFHRLSVYMANRPLRGGLLHGEMTAEMQLPPWIRFESVPHGLFEDAAKSASAFDLRRRFDIPPDCFVLLSFGVIADRKNLELLIEAIARIPGTALVIAGEDVSGSQKPSSVYRAEAARLGVSDRVHFDCRYIEETEISAYFSGADAIALTYKREFVSQSGVLQLAALWDKPILASGGPGPLKDAVESGLGLFVEPDSTDAIVAGLAAIKDGWRGQPESFAEYRRKASWGANVDKLVSLVSQLRKPVARA